MSTSPHSLMREVKLALRDALREKFAGTEVQVSYSMPPHLDSESIWFGAVRFDQNYPVMQEGRKPRDELGSVSVVLWAGKSGQDPEEADERVAELHAVLEDVIADDVTLGGLVQQAGVNDGTNQQVPEDEGSAGYLRVTVVYAARLS